MKNKGVYEWAQRKCNLDQVGCEHNCRYCYAKAMAIRFKRATAESWSVPEYHGVSYIPKHAKRAVTMFPTAHDITTLNAAVCCRQIESILDGGDNVLVVSKASKSALVMALTKFTLDITVRNRIEVRVTIGSFDAEKLRYWEPGAPPFLERFNALQWAHWAGFRTSVSMEPMLDAFPTHVIEVVRPYVSRDRGIWIGRANRLMQTVAVNCPADADAEHRADALAHLWNDERVLKLYGRLKDDPLIRWKDSIRAVVDGAGVA